MNQRVAPEIIERAKATDLVSIAGRYIKLMKRGPRWWASCPFHEGDRDPSFKIEDSRFHCFGCGASGDAIEFVRKIANIGFVEAVTVLSGEEPRPALVTRNRVPQDDHAESRKRETVLTWRGATEPCEWLKPYFNARALPWPPPLSIRAIRGLFVPPNSTWPAMVAAVQSPVGSVIGCQITALSMTRERKACVFKFSGDGELKARKTEGVLAAGAVRLAKAGDVLGVAEGVETGIAAMALSGVPVWCSLGAGRMHQVAIPDGVRELHIFADADEPGRQAAERTARQHSCRRVILRFPPDGRKDWNDVLAARVQP